MKNMEQLWKATQPETSVFQIFLYKIKTSDY